MHGEFSFAVGTLYFSYILKSLNSKNVSEVNSVLCFTGWTWSICDLIIDEDVIVGDEFLGGFHD